MGFNNPAMPWSEFERTLSGRARPDQPDELVERPGSRRREPIEAQPLELDDGPFVPYAELHAHSHYSFLDGASSPAALLQEAARLRLSALAITDHDGLYGAVQLAEAAAAYRRDRIEVKTVFGAELSLGLSAPQNGAPDPEGTHLLVLARGQAGYHALAGAITEAQLADGAEKGRPIYELPALAGAADGQWAVLTGCRKGAVRQALASADGGTDAAAWELDRLVDLFGPGNVVVELFDHGDPLASSYNDALYELAEKRGLLVVATGNVHYATPDGRPLATAVAAVRARRSLDELDGWLPAAGNAHLRSGAEMHRLFGRYPGAIEATVELASDLAFELNSVKPGLPEQEIPEGYTQMSYLRELVAAGIAERYPEGRRPVPLAEIEQRLEDELAVIQKKDFPGYFLIVHDLVREARTRGILCQGRGSAANSAVCYVLGITAIDAIRYRLPFQRFLSHLRDEEPDIDVDFDSRRREEIIQYAFEKYGRRNAAQVATVISYRPKATVRDMAKALGFSPGQQDAWGRRIEDWGGGVSADADGIPDTVLGLARQLSKAPRHLGIHSGGMVLTKRPVGEICPIEHARMKDRTVLQWDKGDVEWMGLVKFDMLGLGMLEALQYIFEIVRDGVGEEWGLASLPKEEPAVYDMLCRADAVGVFQVESRAQLATLPRLQPRRFYDLVVEVALIRPGPIQGGAVHPYLRRRERLRGGDGDPVSYPHPLLESVLKRTLGVPLFQEQIMQMAMAVGGCSPEDADLLRRAMGSKRGVEKIESLKKKLFAGMAENGLTGQGAEAIYEQIHAFADFGFAESHSLSFALLVYASSWLKLHYPAAFLAGLLRAQPMGFYSAETLVRDARRHGVEVRGVDILRSDAHASLEPLDEKGPWGEASAPRPGITGMDECLGWHETGGNPEDVEESEPFDPAAPDESAAHRRDGRFAVRLGLAGVRSIGEKVAERIVAARRESGPYLDLHDLARRAALSEPQLTALAAAGAFQSMGIGRREALWQAGPAGRERADYLPHTAVVVQPPLLPAPSEADRLAYDIWAMGLSPDDHPMRYRRAVLRAGGVLSAAELGSAESGSRVFVGGVVTHRQRPTTASGITFLNLEDETGMVNVIVSTGVWKRHRRVAREAQGMVVRGILERSPEGVVNIAADRLQLLQLPVEMKSRDFQ
ncbi:error-prone DNA polymerase [Gryllotalpicola protaetiae]|uniref:Error-prone DNA polymerase n=1 Tax=Gryllotalpicola protaetiae TaxID=2419771 RepID=A0A387BVE2_9MICO|nr:error-prone DNA polymerase [Gryllotalpicola protaetiae]AYG04837.1 DNA polymerase III subunit alpha [Gryllotalpicola protaetiae]